MLVKSVGGIISKYDMLRSGDSIVVGVSGGHDSVALFHILKELSKENSYRLHIAHVNHGVRGAEADGDEDYVREIARAAGVPFYSKKVDMNRYAEENKLSAEEAGRELRYDFFRDIAENKLNGAKIAVAHNKNDQAETVLMRVMRGTGIDGLKGMDFVNGAIVRPLLSISRIQIEEYCELNNLNPRIDKTNFENIYSRNKVRLELIPYMEKNFNPNLIDTLCRMSDIIRMDADYLEGEVERAYSSILISEKADRISVENSVFRKLDMAIRYRVVRKAIFNLLGTLEGLEEKHIRILDKFSKDSNTGKSIDLIKGVVAKMSYEKLSLEKSEKKETIGYNHIIEVGEALELEEVGGTIKSSVMDIDEIDIDDKNKLKVYFDYSHIDGEIRARSRLPGDKVKLMGMNGRKKLKDYYIDEKVPKEERDIIPLIEIGGEIVWIAGYRSGEKAKVTSKTEKVLVLEYCKNK